MMHSFLLIGQSNMAGRGYLHESREIDTSRIYTLRNGRWQPMFRPINPDRDFFRREPWRKLCRSLHQKVQCGCGFNLLRRWRHILGAMEAR